MGKYFGGFVIGFIVSTVVFMGFALTYVANDEAYIQNTCDPKSEPSELFIQDDADRALVCKYLKHEVGLDQ